MGAEAAATPSASAPHPPGGPGVRVYSKALTEKPASGASEEDSLSSDLQAQESWGEPLVTERYPGQRLERWTQSRWEWILPAGEEFELCSEGDGILRRDQISIL